MWGGPYDPTNPVHQEWYEDLLDPETEALVQEIYHYLEFYQILLAT